MCGIAGIWGLDRSDPVREMMDKMAHRGPDAEGVHVAPSRGALGRRRLSIMDPEGGNQPLYNEARSAVQGMDGMFAFAIADGKDLFLARDPIGIKPLYYGIRDAGKPRQTLYFAAELKALAGHIESFDQDLVRSAIPCYFCSRLTAEHVKVILTGVGADELFAGYTYYKEMDDAQKLQSELRRSVATLHNLNLQRVDRLTMAHGLEGRVPFLDVAMIQAAQTVPSELKLFRPDNGKPIEKWVLRKACEDLLPPEIVWRDKEQFDEGSGTVDLLESILHTATEGLDVGGYAAAYPQDDLRSTEECLYHKMLVESFTHPVPVLQNVARWSMDQWAQFPN